MTPEEKQKADAWMLLTDKDAVTQRVGQIVAGFFESPQAAVWMSGKMVDAEKSSAMMRAPLKLYFESQLERNLRLILAEGVGNEVARLIQPMLDETVKRHAEQVSKDLAELKKLKSKGPVYGRR
jgi:hypothetical protein